MTPLMDTLIGRTARIARTHGRELVIADVSPEVDGTVICSEDEAERSGYLVLYVVSPCGCYTDDFDGVTSTCNTHRNMGAVV